MERGARAWPQMSPVLSTPVQHPITASRTSESRPSTRDAIQGSGKARQHLENVLTISAAFKVVDAITPPTPPYHPSPRSHLLQNCLGLGLQLPLGDLAGADDAFDFAYFQSASGTAPHKTTSPPPAKPPPRKYAGEHSGQLRCPSCCLVTTSSAPPATTNFCMLSPTSLSNISPRNSPCMQTSPANVDFLASPVSRSTNTKAREPSTLAMEGHTRLSLVLVDVDGEESRHKIFNGERLEISNAFHVVADGSHTMHMVLPHRECLYSAHQSWGICTSFSLLSISSMEIASAQETTADMILMVAQLPARRFRPTKTRRLPACQGDPSSQSLPCSGVRVGLHYKRMTLELRQPMRVALALLRLPRPRNLHSARDTEGHGNSAARMDKALYEKLETFVIRKRCDPTQERETPSY